MSNFAIEMKRILSVLLLILAYSSASAQFLVGGGDPPGVRWMKMDTPEFRIIYPAGEDSLARVYGSLMENARIAVSQSSGLLVGKNYKSRLPVVLHSFHTTSNASVAWAPKRMDIYTVKDPYSPTPIPWEKLLALHEGRHAAQMQAGIEGPYRVFHFLVGEMFAGAFAGIFPGPVFLEGDAVVTETALSATGRGRQASFLSYMMPAFDSGDFRDYWQWSFGSNRYYAPDYYRSGYMLISGARVFFDAPLFTKDYFDRIKGGGLLFNLQKTMKTVSGMNFNTAYRTIEESFRCLWNEDALSRGPFIQARQVTPKPWRHTDYRGSVVADGSGIWSTRSGLTSPGSLVLTGTDGKTLYSRAMSPWTGSLSYDKTGNRVWWSESVPHWRWPLGGSSRIRYIDAENPGKVHDLTKTGRYFNPSVSPDGKLVSATEYPSTGGSRVVILNSTDGHAERILQAPDSLQITETAWVGDRLFAAGLSDSGMGIYELPVDGPEGSSSIGCILGPRPVEVSTLRTFDAEQGSALSFVCDRSGVNEFHILDVSTGTLTQATSTRYGIHSPAFDSRTDTLYYSSLAPSDNPGSYRQGNMIYATALGDLTMKVVSFDDLASYRVADALSRQERELAGIVPEASAGIQGTTFSEPRRFHKVIPTIHSWAPFYFNYDNVDNISGDEYYNAASLGATVMFQNLTGDGYGFLGYSAHEDPDRPEGSGAWRHSAHFKYLYTGFLPAVEVSADLGDKAAAYIFRVQQHDSTSDKYTIQTYRDKENRPYFEGTARIYLPVNLSSGGYSRGIVPQVRFKYTNDFFNDKISLQEIIQDGDKKISKETGSLNINHSSRLLTLDFSVRGYVLRDKAKAQVYPRLGIGAEAGFHARPGHSSSFSNTAYLYTYGYLPGILENQGIKLSAAIGSDIGGGEYSYPDTPVSFIPRGFADTNLRSIGNTCAPTRLKLSFDYAIPFLNLDWSGLSPMVYVMNMEITPFVDYSYHKFKYFNDFFVNRQKIESASLASVGADLVLNLGNLFWLPYGSRLGVRYAWNTWDRIDGFNVKGLDHHYFGAIFSVSM